MNNNNLYKKFRDDTEKGFFVLRQDQEKYELFTNSNLISFEDFYKVFSTREGLDKYVESFISAHGLISEDWVLSKLD